MRLTLPSVVAVAFSANMALAKPFMPSLICLNLRDFLVNHPRGDAIKMGQETLCNQNCNPTVGSWDRGGRDFMIGAIEAETERMGAPELKDSFVTLMDGMWEMGNEKCGFSELSGDSMCADPSQAEKVVECLQSNAWRVALSNIGSILPLVTSDSCNKGMGYAANPQTLEEIFPSYLREFLAVCPELE